jgi:bifunctional non-homologous end joining protein LigD
MSLRAYRQKRSFDETPEPKGSRKSKVALPVFCVQKHAASHLHYDFRLEHKGVLLSWAIPKGPSLNPADKRLAIRVEDHPYDYRDFEGEIPKGNYGAGTVMIWDEGSFHLKDATEKKAIAKAIEEGLTKGHLDLVLEGNKLKGAFSLIKMSGDSSQDQWLLIKGRDSYASAVVSKNWDLSVRTNRTLEEIADHG